MNVGYFSVHHVKKQEFVAFEVLQKQKLVDETHYFTHVEFENPLNILMDGKHQKAICGVEVKNDSN